MVVRTQQQDFAEFYRSAADDCLRTVAVSVGDQDTAQELVDEAFARAWASRRTVSRHPAPKAWVVRTALNAGISRWRRRRREVSVPDPARAADLPAASSMVRESVADIRSPTPVDQIISRGHVVRTWRRRVPAAAGALVVAGGAALGVTALAPSGHHPPPTAAGKAGSHPAVVRLAAWTVTKQANGDIDITIKQLLHPAQLQATLRADGLPANVSFTGIHWTGAVCQPYLHASPKLLVSLYRSFTMKGTDFLTIHTSMLPSGVGLTITVQKIKGFPSPVGMGLVHASQQCTG